MSGEADAALERLVDRLASVYETVNGRAPSKVSLGVAVRDAFENCLFLLPGNVYTTTIPAGEMSVTLGHWADRRDGPVEDEPAERPSEEPAGWVWRPTKYEVAQLRQTASRLDAAEAEIKALHKRDAEIVEKVAALFCATWAGG